LLIVGFARTQTQAIQFSVFFLLPVFVLFRSVRSTRTITPGDSLHFELFPLTHFALFACVNMYGAGLNFYVGDLLIFSGWGTVITFLGRVSSEAILSNEAEG